MGGMGGNYMASLIAHHWHSHHAAAAAQAAARQTMQRRVPPPPYYRDLLGLSSALIAEGRYELRYELAVIVAQMACEIVVEQTLTPPLVAEQTLTPRLKGKKPPKPPKTFNLEGGRGAALSAYTRLTHDKSITKEPFWKPFVRHANLRHQVIHFSARVGQAEAQKSLTVATQFVDHVERVREAPKGK